jgi:hypothetical protein
VAKAHGVPEGAGFVFELPLALADPAATTKLRFFAVRNEQASELSYPRRLH